MGKIFYHASHEQFSPKDLLHFARMAEKAGFDGCHSSDHFHPWSERQGQSGHLFSWLGAALEATQFPISFINAPGQRYHPAVVAQALATLAQMYPDRITVELGSGEALNEHITGDPWLPKPERNQRLLECAGIIRRLFAGEQVNHEGLVRVRDARLYTLPSGKLPPIFCAAVTDATARWAGSWADGFITIYKPINELLETIRAFHDGGGVGNPVHVKLTFSYARRYADAEEAAYDQWRSNCLDAQLLEDLDTPEAFDRATEGISREQVLDTIPVSDDPLMFAGMIEELFEAGVEVVALHNVNRNQEEFITDFARQLLPIINK